MVITGARKGIGGYLVDYYVKKGFRVVGCSRNANDYKSDLYRHFCLHVSDEPKVKAMFRDIRREYGGLDILINNAGIASMNSFLLTPLNQVRSVLDTNVVGTFLLCREAAKIMALKRYGRIINFTTAAVPLKLEGEASYVASKASVVSLTEVLARELADMGITVNAVGPTLVETDLIRSVPQTKIRELLKRQAIGRLSRLEDISNVIDFFIRPESEFVTGQVIFLGGV